MKISDLYNKKGFFLIIGIFIVWIFISSYWYVCNIKEGCANANNELSLLVDIDENIETRRIERSTNVVQKIITCSPYVKIYLGSGYINEANEVAKLQKFFNEQEGFTLDIDGKYGPKTKQAVVDFQNKYEDEILEIGSFNYGIIEQETRLQINKVYCRNKAKGVL